MDPYADVAAFYDAEFGAIETDIAFYARHGAGGTLLVLGCGTGRVCRGLEALRPVVGVDRSEPMLAIARTRSRARYVQGDLRDFDVGPVDEIVVPNASFNFLATRAEQQQCLAACHRALPSGSPLWLDLPMPDFARLAEPHTPEKPAWDGVIGGRKLARTREVRRSAVEGRLELVDRYYVDDAYVATSTLNLRLVFPAEVEWMLEACGFWVDATYGDHAGRRVSEGCPRLIVRAIRAS